ATKYAQLSPYNYADNNPVNDYDIDGMQNKNTPSSASKEASGSSARSHPSQNRGDNLEGEILKNTPTSTIGIDNSDTLTPSGGDTETKIFPEFVFKYILTSEEKYNHIPDRKETLHMIHSSNQRADEVVRNRKQQDKSRTEWQALGQKRFQRSEIKKAIE